jgi:TolB-like protein/Tfp pilus assembly protein PilF
VKYRFDQFEVDTEQYRLTRQDSQIPIKPLVFDLLTYLLENRDRVITRAELLDELWPGKVVTDAALAARVKDARKALRDSGTQQKIIKTIYRRGYQFVAELIEDSGLQASATNTVAENLSRGDGLMDKPSIAVLPLANLSQDPEQEYFSDGITEGITTELSRFRELIVVANNSSYKFKQRTIDISDVAERLGVQYIVEGSVRKVANRVRVSVQLLNASAGSCIWAERYDRTLDDIFVVQDDVVRSIVGVLPGRVTEAVAENQTRRATVNMTAHDLLMRANHVLYRRGDYIRVAIDLYRQAIALDPEFAASYAGIAVAEGMSVWDLSYYDDNPLGRAFEAGKRAIELDGSDYRSHAAFGEALRQLGRHEQARDHLEQALSLNPNSARVLGYRAMLQAYDGDPEGAVNRFYQASRLDPLSRENLRPEVLSEAYYNMREYQKSLVVLESMLKLPIFYVYQQMAMCHAQLGNQPECDRRIAQYQAQLPDSYDEQLLYESHLRLCARQEDREHWQQGYRLIGMQV